MHQPWRIKREELRSLLGIEAKEYGLWGDFRRYVLERAQVDISAHTDVAFDIEYIKTGQSVSELVFRLRKEGGSNVELLPGTDKHKVFKGMLEIGLAAKDAEHVLQEWWEIEPQRVTWHLSEGMKTSGKVNDACGWFRSASRTTTVPTARCSPICARTRSRSASSLPRPAAVCWPPLLTRACARPSSRSAVTMDPWRHSRKSKSTA